MAKYNNQSIMVVKNMLVTRLQYLIAKSKLHHSQAQIARDLGVSPMIISKLARGIGKGISFDALLVVAERSKLRYMIAMSFDGHGNRKYKLELEPVYESIASRVVDKLGSLFTPSGKFAN